MTEQSNAPQPADLICRCGHPFSHHGLDGTSCWTDEQGREIWDGEPACPCSWMEVVKP